VRGELLPLVPTLALAAVLVVAMFVQSLFGPPPARVDVGPGGVTITMQGAMPFFALRRRLRLRLDEIATVHADGFARNLIGGFRIGTAFPKVMHAGWFHRGRGGWDFFAVHGASSALVLDLVPGRRRFRRVIVEIADLRETAAAIEAALVRAAATA
jgi:hypothetical protein